MVAGLHSSVSISRISRHMNLSTCTYRLSMLLDTADCSLRKIAASYDSHKWKWHKLLISQIQMSINWGGSKLTPILRRPVHDGHIKATWLESRGLVWCIKEQPWVLDLAVDVMQAAAWSQREKKVRGIVMWDNRVNSECRSLLPLWPTFLPTKAQSRASRMHLSSSHNCAFFCVQLSGARQILTYKFACCFFVNASKRFFKCALKQTTSSLIWQQKLLSVGSWGLLQVWLYFQRAVGEWCVNLFFFCSTASVIKAARWLVGIQDVVQGSFIPGKPFKKKRKQCERMQNVSWSSHAAKTRKICADRRFIHRVFVCWHIAHEAPGCQWIFYSVWFTRSMYVCGVKEMI